MSIRSSSHDIILIEVDSKGYESTIVQLVEGVIEQLVWLRNRDDSVTSCVGFYFPAKDRGPGVVEVKVEWSDSAFCFQIKEFAIEQHRVKTAIASCMDNGVQRVNGLQGKSATLFTLPLSKSFIAGTFGEDAHQVDSSRSVVIVNKKEKKVYKKPFCATSLTSFSDVRLLSERQSSSVTKFQLPQRIFELDKIYYYVFDMLKGPLSRELARLYVRDLAFSVWLALCEFHSFGYAHLDVRLENICYNDNNEAVLIDLDHAVNVNDGVWQRVFKSLMYPFNSTFTSKNWDFVQLGLMLIRIILPTSNYHQDEPDFSNPIINHDFLKTLYINGKKCSY